jgi:uncharacterized surface protein with fasciclin (FAS1) repeats
VESVAVEGTPLTAKRLEVGGDTVEVTGGSRARIIEKDVVVANGFVQVIDAVLIPS